MMKSVYIETSVLSYLAARPSRDPKAAILQSITMEWWEKERHAFQLFTSALVLAEVRFGDPNASRRRIELLQDLTFLDIVEDAETLADTLVGEGAVPGKARSDALHISIASVHELDYLLTWNCRHINNAATKPKIRSISAAQGYACPEICTPLELLSEEDDV